MSSARRLLVRWVAPQGQVIVLVASSHVSKVFSSDVCEVMVTPRAQGIRDGHVRGMGKEAGAGGRLDSSGRAIVLAGAGGCPQWPPRDQPEPVASPHPHRRGCLWLWGASEFALNLCRHTVSKDRTSHSHQGAAAWGPSGDRSGRSRSAVDLRQEPVEVSWSRRQHREPQRGPGPGPCLSSGGPAARPRYREA